MISTTRKKELMLKSLIAEQYSKGNKIKPIVLDCINLEINRLFDYYCKEKVNNNEDIYLILWKKICELDILNDIIEEYNYD